MLQPIFITLLIITPLIFNINIKENSIIIRNNTLFDKYYLLCICVFFCLQNALRGSEIGNDTLTYLELYDTIARESFSNLKGFLIRYELGYVLLNKVLSYISSDSQTLLISVSVIIYSIWYRFIKNFSKIYWWSIFLLFTLRIVDNNMNIVRQALAIVIVISSYYPLRKKQFIKFLVTVLFAALIHKTAIIFLISWSIHYIKVESNFLLKFLSVCTITYVFGSVCISLLFHYGIVPAYYLDSEYLETGKVAPLINIIINSLIWLFIYLSKSYRILGSDGISDNKYMFLLLSIGVCISLLNLHFSIFSRICSYFTLFSIILLPNSLCAIRSSRKFFTYSSLIFTLFILYYFVIITYRPYWIYVYPYKLCF